MVAPAVFWACNSVRGSCCTPACRGGGSNRDGTTLLAAPRCGRTGRLCTGGTAVTASHAEERRLLGGGRRRQQQQQLLLLLHDELWHGGLGPRPRETRILVAWEDEEDARVALD